MPVAPNQGTPTLGTLEAEAERVNETGTLEKMEGEASLKDLRLCLRLLPRKQLSLLLDEEKSDRGREVLREAMYFRMDLYEFANFLAIARGIWRICPTLVMSPEYDRALMEACSGESELGGSEFDDDDSDYNRYAPLEAGLLPELSREDIEAAFKASLPRLMEEFAELQQ